MSWTTYFIQECPACGRRLQVRVAYLGRQVVCQHCERRFEARDPDGTPDHAEERSIDLLRRANELLESVELSRSQRAVG